MSINIDPEKFAELVVSANPSKSEDVEDIAKDSLKLYINAYRLAERYANIATNCYDWNYPRIEKNRFTIKINNFNTNIIWKSDYWFDVNQ